MTNMKTKAWFVFATIICSLFLALNSASGAGVADESITTASGMPPCPIPEKPIPHHNPVKPLSCPIYYPGNGDR
jgi:hypothetical protein